jgi:hypothetical protein
LPAAGKKSRTLCVTMAEARPFTAVRDVGVAGAAFRLSFQIV